MWGCERNEGMRENVGGWILADAAINQAPVRKKIREIGEGSELDGVRGAFLL